MRLHSDSFPHLGRIPPRYAFGRPGVDAPLSFSDNENPHLAWDDVPAGSASFALICVDTDVPTVFDHVNQTGHVLPKDMPRQDFIHWVMADIPASVRELAAGSCARGVVKGGKQNPPGPPGAVQGINDYGSFMGDGDYYGYDGPCPPWNDERLHHYHFRLYALSVPTLGLAGRFTARDLTAAMAGKILAVAEWTGTYSLNPTLAG
jgi:Raf kinase inhibitor-like YbhB/YbcL family protein